MHSCREIDRHPIEASGCSYLIAIALILCGVALLSKEVIVYRSGQLCMSFDSTIPVPT